LAGRRLHSDPRNSLFRDYLEIVSIIRPPLLFLENVQGFELPFRKRGRGRERTRAYSEVVREELSALGYLVFSKLVDFSEYGVPQRRRRFILLGVRKSSRIPRHLGHESPFSTLHDERTSFLSSKGLQTGRPTSVKDAIADLETSGAELETCRDSRAGGFKQISYKYGESSPFVQLMRRGCESLSPTSLRLPKHKLSTVEQFECILRTCKRGQTLHKDDRERLGIKKQALTPLDPNRPASTVTTLPDDMIHYSEPRILTVRENARIQTFPDWFVFTGNYTTGGKIRKKTCPRYTQVGNAVPPLFSEIVGKVLSCLVQRKS
jgi:DNA (cytosine-5)-methyltransferase 1